MGDVDAGTAGSTADLDGDDGLTAGDVVGGYRIESRIARGAMGCVYRARQLSMQRDVALKVLPRHLAADPDYAKRFQREARITGACDHPNLVRVFEVGEADGWSFYAMELVDGPTLGRLVAQQGPLDERRAARWLGKLAGALGAAHRLGIVHRDVKPDNILLAAGEEPKLADLGLAKRADGSGDITAAGETIGTPRFMAPEQARGEAVDARADLYSLGSTFFYLVTGRHVYPAASAQAALIQQSREDAPRARQFVPGLSRGFDDVLARLLVRDRDARYRDAEQVIADLARVERTRTAGRAATRPMGLATGPVPVPVSAAITVATMAPTPATRRESGSPHLRTARLHAAARWPLWVAAGLIAAAAAGSALLFLPAHASAVPAAHASDPTVARADRARGLSDRARHRAATSDADYERMIADLQLALTEGAGTAAEREVGAALDAARAARAALRAKEAERAARAAADCEAAGTRAAALLAEGDIDAAWQAWAALREEDGERVAAALLALERTAKQRFGEGLESADAASQSGDHDQARAELDRLAAWRWRGEQAAAAERIAALRARVDEREQAARSAVEAARARLARGIHADLRRNDLAGARAKLAAARRDPALGDDAAACAAVVDLLAARPAALRAALADLDGKEATLTLKGQKRHGTVVDVDDNGFAVVMTMKAGGGTAQARIAAGWSDLDPAEAEALIRTRWKPDGAAGRAADAYCALAHGDGAAALAATAAAVGHPLAADLAADAMTTKAPERVVRATASAAPR